MNDMRGITLWQPWATLMAQGIKKFETRSWETSYRGKIAIHSAAIPVKTVLKKVFPLGEWSYAPDYEAKRALLKELKTSLEDYAPIDDINGYLDQLPTGCILAVGDLVGCYEMKAAPGNEDDIWIRVGNSEMRVRPGDTEYCFGYWEAGRFAWDIQNVKILTPIPAKGKQGLWKIDEELYGRILHG